MKRFSILTLSVSAMIVSSCSQKQTGELVWVNGGGFDFYIGAHEVTQKEWTEVMETNPSKFHGDNLPVETVSWYECVEYCNKRSIKEGLTPYYNIEKNKKDTTNTNDLDDIKWKVGVNEKANGYRLPTEAEWEYACRGGRLSRHFSYSGSNSINDVAWYWQNSGDKYLTGNWAWPALQANNNKTHPVGARSPNELGLYDMSGNVREWCWDRYDSTAIGDTQGRTWKGGGWMGADFCCEPSFRANFEANGKGPDQGLRVCHNK